MADPVLRQLDMPDENAHDGMVLGTNRSRLAMSMAMSRVPEQPVTFSESEASINAKGFEGVANPYGGGIRAYEPNNELYNQYENAYDAVQQSKADEAAKAAAQTFTDVPGMSAQGPVGPVNLTGVPYANLFAAAGAKYGISPAVLAAVARAESAFRPDARSGAGALGLMQFMPATARSLGVNPLDPASAIDGAARYLKQNLDKFGTIELALAAYNAGPGAVSKYNGIPPYAETQNYVTRVTGYMSGYAGTPGAPAAGGSTLGDASGKVATAVRTAISMANRGVPYVWGGSSANGVDCSGLIHFVYQAAGVNLPRYRAVDYGHMGQAVSIAQARPGDVVYYDEPGTTTDHVGIYIGNGQMVQAPTTGQRVKISSIGTPTSIRRLFEDSSMTTVAMPGGHVTTAYNGTPWAPMVGTYQPGLSTGINTAQALGTIRRVNPAPGVHGTPL